MGYGLTGNEFGAVYKYAVMSNSLCHKCPDGTSFLLYDCSLFSATMPAIG